MRCTEARSTPFFPLSHTSARPSGVSATSLFEKRLRAILPSAPLTSGTPAERRRTRVEKATHSRPPAAAETRVKVASSP